MSEQIPPQVLPTTEPAGEPIEPLSVADKIIGVLSEPSATFENVKQAGPRTSDWVIPMLILCIIGAIAAYIVTTNPTMRESILEKTREQFDKQIASGKMKQEQADQAMVWTERLITISGVGVALIGTPIRVFFMVLIYWLLLKYALKGAVTYSLLLSVYGLTIYIDIINQLLSLIISFMLGNIYASISLGAFMKPDLTSPLFKLMSALNPITIWFLFLLGIGFAKVSDLSKEKTWGLVFGLWIVWTLTTALIKIPFMG